MTKIVINLASAIRRTFSSVPSVNLKQTLTHDHITKAIKQQPLLSKFNENAWHNTHNIFHQHGLNTSTFLSIVKNHPPILSRSIDKLEESLACWRCTQFGEKNLFQLFEHNPELLEFTDENHLRHRLAHIKSYALNTKNIWRIFMNSPNVLTEEEYRIDEKIKYFRDIMKANVMDVVKSCAFSYPLETIRIRHVFLMRLGLYKPINIKDDNKKENKNPPIFRILDTDDEVFATKVGMVTLDEFEAFKLLYRNELKVKNHQSEDVD